MSRFTHPQYRQPFFLDAYSLLQRIENNKLVNLKDNEVPYNKRILLYDICLKAKNQEEDQLYGKNKFLRMNVRMGQTVVQFLDNETQRPYATFFGRKGLIKFFNLEKEYLMDNLDKALQATSPQMAEIKEVIFSPIQQALYQNYPVEIYAMNKVNGYNCQISYIVTKRAWIIACKNISLLARDREDVSKYSSDKYLKIRLVAEEWFNQLNRMAKKNINIQELQSYLEKHTLIGEYCGHSDYEQLIKYPKIQLNFYAIVNHLSHHTCLPPQQAFRIFESFYLRQIKMSKVANIYKWNQLNEELLKLYDKIQSASLEKYDEGCVLYIVKKIEGPNYEEKEEMLSMCKVQSLEYLIYAKLKEKLKSLIQKHQQSKEFLFEQFQEEVIEICQHNQPNKPINFYLALANTAFDYVIKSPFSAKYVHDKFITFISVLFYCLANNLALMPQFFTDPLIISEPWSHYNDFIFLNFADQQNQQMQQTQQQPNQQQQDFSQQHQSNNLQQQKLLSAIQAPQQPIQPPQQPIQTPQQPIQTPQQPIQTPQQIQTHQQIQTPQQISTPYQPIQSSIKKIADKILEEKKLDMDAFKPVLQFQSEIRVVVLIPVGIPGFGKTFYCEFLKTEIESKQIGTFLIISSDKIRKEQMELLQQKTTEPLSQQRLFDETAKSATQLFRKTLKQVIENLPYTHGPSKDSITFIMLDKTHPPNSLDLTQKLLREYCSQHPEIQLKIVALFPASICPFFRYKKDQEQLTYPFSLHYFFTCLKRVQQRKVHETLIGDHENSALIVLYFIQLFRNANVSKEAIEKYGFDLKLRLPFLYEDAKSNEVFNEILIEKFKAVLSSIVPFKECNMELLKDFVTYFENYNFSSREIITKDLIKGAEYGIQACRRLFPDYNEIPQYPTTLATNIVSENLSKDQQQIQDPQQFDSYSYNPSKLPTSLGIWITKEQESKHQIIEFIRGNLLNLMNIMPEMSKLRQEYDKLPAIFQFPKILHLTTLHIEKDKKKTETTHFVRFRDGVEVKVRLIGILYLPGKIITGLCQVKELPFGMTVETEFPHLTLMVGETPPKMSTILLNAVFGKGGKFEGAYNDPTGVLLGNDTVVDKFKIKIGKKQEDAFIVKGENGLDLTGKTEAWFS